MPQAMLDDHRDLRALADELDTLLDGAIAPTPAIAQARWALARTLMRHLAQEPAVLARLATGPALAPVLAGHRGGREAALRERLARHMRDWPAERIGAFFPLFRVELRRLLRALEECMRFEEAVLYASPGAKGYYATRT